MVVNPDIKEIIETAAQRGSFIREKFDSRNLPDSMQKIIVLPVFSEISHLMVFANLILPSIRNDINFKDKYIIIVTWKGFAKFLPQADEVWSIKSTDNIDRFYEKVDGMMNKSEALSVVHRSLNEYFRNVVEPIRFANWFQNGFNRQNINRDVIQIFKQSIPNINYLNQNVVKNINDLGENKAFIIPFKYIKRWHLGKVVLHKLSPVFYQNVIDGLIAKNCKCVVLKNYLSFDLSKNYLDNKNVFSIQEDDWFLVMAYMLATKMYVDLFSGISSLAMYCGCRSISIVERNFHTVSNSLELESCMTNNNTDVKLFSFFDLNSNLINKKLFFIDKLFSEIVNTDFSKYIENHNSYSINLRSGLDEKIKKFHPKFIGIKKKVIEE